MRILYILFFLNIFLVHTGYCNSIRTNEGTRHSEAQYSVLLYFEKTGKLPSSWHDLRQVEESNKYVDIIEGKVKYGKKNDFVKNFRFVPCGIKICIRGGTERVIAMSTQSVTVSQSSTRPKYRLMVVQKENGGITTSQYTEEQTAKLFELAGFDLADYTGSGGKWQPEPKQSATEYKEEEGSSDIDRKNLDTEKRLSQSGNSKGAKVQKSDKSLSNGSSTIWILLGIPVMGFLAWVITRSWRKKNNA